MVRSALAVQAPSATGLTPSFTAANVDGHTLPTDCVLVVKNGAGSSINVTVETGAVVAGRAVADDVIAVPNGQERWIALTDRALLARQADPDRGKVYVNFSSVTSITCGAFALP